MYEQMQLRQEKALKERELLFQEQQKQFLTQLRQLSTEKQEQEKLLLQKELERLRQDQRIKEEKEAREAKALEATEQLLKQQEVQAVKAREEKQQQDEDARRKKQVEEEEKQKKVEEEAKRRKQKEEDDLLQEQKKRVADEEREKLRLQKLKEEQEKEQQAKLQKQKQEDEREKQEKQKEKEEVIPSDATPSDLSHLLASFRPVEPPILVEQPSTYGRCRYADHMDPTYESGARSASQERSFSRELVHKYHRHRSISPPASSSQIDVVVDPVSGKQRPAFHVTPRSRGVIDEKVLSQLREHAYTFEPMMGMVPELMTFMNGGGSQALTTSG
jgi:chemotaxis protein histidine kinase CheA